MNRLIIIIFVVFNLTKIFSQTTFDWENAIDTGPTIEQTVNGITVQFSLDVGNPRLYNASGFGGTSGNIATESSWVTGSVALFSFSTPINITSIYVVEGASLTPDAQIWTFTPSPIGGSNSSVSESIPGYDDGGANITLNWTSVSSFTVTSAGSPVYFGFDNIESDFNLNVENNQKREEIKIYPNPTSGFVSITGLQHSRNFTIYNSIGIPVLEDTINVDEKINISNLQDGVYLLKLDKGSVLRFIK